MTPLIDVVFLLIIFFLVSSHLARRENLFPVELPAAGSPTIADPDLQRLTLTIDAGGRLLALGREIKISELETLVGDQARASGQPPAVRIRSDASVPYRLVAPILRTVAMAGCTDIVVAARRDFNLQNNKQSRNNDFAAPRFGHTGL